MNNYKIDGNQITLLDARFYEVNGQFVPSVSTILQAYPKDASFYQWLKEVGKDADAIRDAAGERGSTVHRLTELADEGHEISLLDMESGNLKYSLQEWAMLGRYIDFRRRFPLHVIASELQLISIAAGYAGTLDRYIEMDGKRYIIDIKTSNSLWAHYWLQLAAYRNIFTELTDQPVDGVGILWLNAKTRTNGTKGAIQGAGWQLLTKEDSTEDLRLFEATRSLWLAQNGELMPRNISYQLTQKI
jgi:hypothetical protein